MSGLPFPDRQARQRGLTLVELMISIVLGMLVVLAATALLVSSKSSYIAQDDGTQMQDTARFALENINRSLRQAGFENWGTIDSATKNEISAPIVMVPTMEANLVGLDARRLKEDTGTPGIDNPQTSDVVNGSDVLAVRFFGVSKPGSTDADESIVDCAGNGVSAPASQNTADEDRGWSIYYVAKDAAGVPELRCKYRNDAGSTWGYGAIARGVESFQVLYGVDTDGDRIANQFMTATQIKALDAGPPVRTNIDTYWKKVTAVKVALLLRGAQARQAEPVETTYHLFGPDYTDANGSNDAGASIAESSLPAETRRRSRKVYMATIQFRNQPEGSGS
ncbi:MAG: PilW family protein [Burkholderiaceae bacterium]